MCAVAGLALSGTRFASPSIFLKGISKAIRIAHNPGSARIRQKLPRARNFRLNQHRSYRCHDHGRQQSHRVGSFTITTATPPKAINLAMLAIIIIAASIVAATELIKISLCLTFASSCAITPSSSRSSSRLTMPSVAATAAYSRSRPVANAFGEAVGIM